MLFGRFGMEVEERETEGVTSEWYRLWLDVRFGVSVVVGVKAVLGCDDDDDVLVVAVVVVVSGPDVGDDEDD